MRKAKGRGFFSICACCPPTDGANADGMSRRAFMATGIAAGAVAAAATPFVRPAAAQTVTELPVTERKIVDMHHHIAPPDYLAETRARQNPPVVNWSIQKSLEDMEKAGVATSITSITTPGVWFGDAEQAKRLARVCNEYAARLTQDHPGRFGMFAMLPLPDVDASLKELEYAMDTLKADGIALLTSFGDKWLGDPAFDPIMSELNRRSAILYTHPTTANCCRNLVPSVPPAMIEYGTDTTRAIASVVLRGTARKYPNVKFIFSHAGGTMPFLIERFTRLGAQDGGAPGAVEATLKTFHYDIAQTSHRIPLRALVDLVSTSQIVFGTDFPFRTAADHENALLKFGFTADELRAINRENALKLLPKYRA
jgi:predicted TIM-barrel fold metal-dependent hydrolase